MMYRPNFYESTCLRCNEIVYQVDRVGPLKDFTFFHAGCFKCANCGTKLTLKTYYNNQHKQEDKEVIQYSVFMLKHIETHESTFDPSTHRSIITVAATATHAMFLDFYCRFIVIRMYQKVAQAISIRRRLAFDRRSMHPNQINLSTNRFAAVRETLKVSRSPKTKTKSLQKKTKYENVKARWTFTRAHTPFDAWLNTFALTLYSFVHCPLSTLHCAPNEVITTPTCTCTRKRNKYINP